MQKQQQISHFTVGKSRLKYCIINALHIVSAWACWANDLPLIFQLSLTVMVLGSWYFQKKTEQAENIYLRYTANGGWFISLDGSEFLGISIKPETLLNPLLIVLSFQMERRSRTLLILNDAMQANEYRKLVVLLKISGLSQPK
jgi:hypothetical protein